MCMRLHVCVCVLQPLSPSLPLRKVKADGSIDFYPVQFRVYRHTTLPPPGKPSSLPWPIASVFGTLGITSSKPAPPSVLSSAGVGSGVTEGGPLQPTIPRRVLYYYAAFTARTTIREVCVCVYVCWCMCVCVC